MISTLGLMVLFLLRDIFAMPQRPIVRKLWIDLKRTKTKLVVDFLNLSIFFFVFFVVKLCHRLG